MVDMPSVDVRIDLSPVVSIVERLREGIDNIWKGLGEVRDRISAELRATLETVIPKIGEAIAGAIASFGTLVDGLLDNLSTLPDVHQMLTAALVDPTVGRLMASLEGQAPKELEPVKLLASRGAAASELRSAIDDLPPGVKGFLNIATAVASLFAICGAYQASTIELYKQASFEEVRPALLTAEQVVEGLRRGEISEDYSRELLNRQGLSDAQQLALRRLSYSLPTPLEIVTLERRGELSSEEAADWLARIGYEPATADILRAATLAVPSPQDIVSLAGREAFEDKQAADLGLDAEYEDVDWSWADKIGLKEPWRKMYWRAHWETVSPGHIFEMRQRTTDNPDPKVGGTVTTPSGLTFNTIISDSMVDAGMKWIDYTPQWREALLQLAYRPLTRVDVRRMNDLGELDFAGVVRAYLDLGYTPENAERLAKFSQTLVERSKKIARLKAGAPMQRVVLEAYVKGSISEEDAREALSSLEYTQAEIGEVIARADYERECAKADAIRSGVRRLYVAGMASDEEASSLLKAEAFSEREASYLLDLWRPERTYKELTEYEKHEKDLSKADLLAAYRELLASREDTVAGLMLLGYSELEAGSLVGLEDAKAARSRLKDVQAVVRAQYMAGRIERAQAWAELSSAGMPEDRLELLLSKWDIERDARTPDLPIATIEQLAREELISPEDVAAELVRRGYTDKEAEWLTKLWGRRMVLSERELELKERKLQQDWQLQQAKLEAGVAKDLRVRQTQLDVAAAKLEGSLKVEAVRSSRAYGLLDKQLAAKDKQIAQQTSLALTLQQRKEDLALALERARSESAKVKIEAEMLALEKKLAAQAELAQVNAAAKAELEAQKAAQQAERDKQLDMLARAAETRKEQALLAKEQRAERAKIDTETRAEARQIAKESRGLAATLTLETTKASKEALLAAAQSQALAAYEASLKDLVARLMADAQAQLARLTGSGGMVSGKAY